MYDDYNRYTADVASILIINTIIGIMNKVLVNCKSMHIRCMCTVIEV